MEVNNILAKEIVSDFHVKYDFKDQGFVIGTYKNQIDKKD